MLPAAAAPAAEAGVGAEVVVGENSAWIPCASNSNLLRMQSGDEHTSQHPVPLDTFAAQFVMSSDAANKLTVEHSG